MRRIMFLTTASAILALSMGNLVARAAEGEGHGGQHGGAHAEGGHEGAHVGPNSGVHVENHGVVRVAPNHIPHEGDVSIFGGKEHREDGWRYRYENGAWWYWMPNNRWTYYDNGGWQDYAVDNVAPSVPVATDPNFYWFHDQWWYAHPGNRWSYYDHGHWNDGAPGMGPTRREVEHHGEVKHEEHHDEHHEEHHEEHKK